MINMARIKRGVYFDSITLMQVAHKLTEMEGIEQATALIATPTNLQLLTEAGLTPFIGVPDEPEESDLLIVVRASDEVRAEAALAAAEALLLRNVQGTTSRARASGLGELQQPRSLEEARQMKPGASIAVISVPGAYAALEAAQALRAGLHVFLFSDNVSLEEEIALKRLGEERDLLVMGPDCGTARLNGVGLGFVNVVPDGPIGLVGASGTGMQQVMCLLAQAGYGISQAIGCGGRDLSSEVGAITTLRGLRLLQEDAQTQVIVLISKPPAPAVAERVLTAASSGNKPVVVIFVGSEPQAWPGNSGSQVHIARTLTQAAHMAVQICKTGTIGQQTEKEHTAELLNPRPSSKASSEIEHTAESLNPRSSSNYLAALFSGGTLCDEALHIWGERLGPVYSNIPLNPAWSLQHAPTSQKHYALDLGADEYTQGRPHPMIDPSTRLKYLHEATSDPQVGVILLDIVLGYCAHANPAEVYAPVIQAALQQANQAGRSLHCIISLCGTEGDPQGLSQQAARLREVGAEVYTSNAEAAERCLLLLQ
jgi:FdrA protein